MTRERRPRWLQLPARLDRVDRQVEEELRFHLDARVESLMQSGHPIHEAREIAEREFGSLSAARKELAMIDRRAVRRSSLREQVAAARDDVHAALRAIRRSPLFSLTVVVTMALGISASASIFSLVDRLMLRPAPHVVDGGRLHVLYHNVTFPAFGQATQISRSYRDYQDLRGEGEKAIFDRMGGFFESTASYGYGLEAREVPIMHVSGSFFETVGVRPHRGRFFSEQESLPPLEVPVAVLGHGLWQREFGGRDGVIGESVDLLGRRFTIVGVAPPGFRGLGIEPVDVFLPLAAFGLGSQAWITDYGFQLITVVGRLAPGVTRQQAEVRATAVFRRAHDDDVNEREAVVRLGSAVPGRGPNAGPEGKVSVVLFVVSLLVLAIATANVGNLLLTRAHRRQREIAVRLTLGVSRRRLAAQLLTESSLLALIGAAVAVVAARWAGDVIRVVLFPEIDRTDLVVDARVLAVATVTAVVVGIVAGMAPLTAVWRRDLSRDLRSGVRDGGYRQSRLRMGLLVLQATLSMTLLIGAALFARSLQNALGVDVGFDPRRVHVVLHLGSSRLSVAERFDLYQRARDRVTTLPFVEAAALATTVPFWMNQSVRLRVEGLDSLPTLADGTPATVSVDPTFLATMGMTVRRGRALGDGDVAGAPRVAVINQHMERHLFAGRDALGRCLYIGQDSVPPCTRVVGVVSNMRRWSLLKDESSAQYYVPIAQRPAGNALALMVRTSRDDPSLAMALSREIQRLDERLPHVSVQPMLRLLEPQLRSFRVGASLFAAFGAIALLLAAVGLYSVVAYDSAQRGHELGVRMALGSGRGAIARLVLGHGLQTAGAGVLLGVVVALAASWRIEEFLFRVSPRDPWLIGGAASVLLLVSLAASLVPAWRATRLDPASVLRAE